MIQGAPELNNKIQISLYLLVAMIILAFSMGGTIATVLDNDDQRQSENEALKARIQKLENFLLLEIQGLRDDCDRRFNEVIKPRIEDLEEQHKVYKIE